MKIYVASSWRNKQQPKVVKSLRKAGHEVYDFRHPEDGDNGFHWSEIDQKWQDWTPEIYRESLSHPLAQNGFKKDIAAMKWADAFVGVQPFGRSASMEMGWAAGQGKTTVLLLDKGEPELMVKMFDHICCNLREVIDILRTRAPDYTKYKLRMCRTLHLCNVCGEDILSGQNYYDGGYARRAHEECAEITEDIKAEGHGLPGFEPLGHMQYHGRCD